MQPFDLENSVENLIVQNRVKGFSFYVLLLLFLLGVLAALPFIFVDVSSQARGFIRASKDAVPSLMEEKIKERIREEKPSWTSLDKEVSDEEGSARLIDFVDEEGVIDFQR